MSASDLEKAFEKMHENTDLMFFAGPRPDSLILLAESALGGHFPPTYRKFLEQFGAGNFGSFEIFGVIDNNFYTSSVPNGVWLTLKERIEKNIPDDFFLIGSTGDGDYYGLKMMAFGESPVYICRVGFPTDLEQAADNFGKFLLENISEQL